MPYLTFHSIAASSATSKKRTPRFYCTANYAEDVFDGFEDIRVFRADDGIEICKLSKGKLPKRGFVEISGITHLILFYNGKIDFINCETISTQTMFENVKHARIIDDGKTLVIQSFDNEFIFYDVVDEAYLPCPKSLQGPFQTMLLQDTWGCKETLIYYKRTLKDKLQESTIVRNGDTIELGEMPNDSDDENDSDDD